MTPVESEDGFDISESLPTDLHMAESLEKNLTSAVRLACLMKLKNGEKTNLDDLILQICSLSYLGNCF